ncbi:MAG: hypothetical protein WA003_12920 [Desulfuromonadaceae bacterium]
MILHPGILSLLVSSLLTALMMLYSATHGVRILRHWNISSGSEFQLSLERKTYLISTIVSYFLGFQLVSLFLFILTAGSISGLFVGAMCAVGTLTVNGFGYPTLILKVVTFLLAGFWLILNHADSLGYDYPLIRSKYFLLLVMTPFILAETLLQGLYFLGLKPDIITSCCGTLFSPATRGLATEIVNAPPLPVLALFYASSGVTLLCGAWFTVRGSGGGVFALLNIVQLAVALIATISVISLYIYQMPAHHCPFCILQKEYYLVGYLLYISMFVAAICGFGSGWLERYRSTTSLADDLPGMIRTLARVSLFCTVILVAIASGYILLTGFTMR